ncbi:hypothetical protein, partial [Helicobacter pylori]|uniref:hypothetical protein n=1 Tax=Helicobacter pylori TaxID=210 RepID=UPI0019693808
SLAFLFDFIIDYILVLYFSVAFSFLLFLVVLVWGLIFYSKVFACLFCLSFFIVFNDLITRIGMFCFV